MNEYLLVPQDEYPHAPTSDMHFNESVYTNVFDHRKRLGGWMRIGNRVNEGYAEVSVCLYLPGGRIACQFLRPDIATNEAFDAGGLRVTIEQPLAALTMHYAGEVMLVDDPHILREPKRLFAEAVRASAKIEWQHVGCSPLHGGLPVRADQQTMFGRDFSLGHFNQHTVAKGAITVGEHHWQIDGYGWRDHSWGPRLWQNILFDRGFYASFGDDCGITLLKIANTNGSIRRAGVLFVDGDYEPILDLDIDTSWDQQRDPVAVTLNIRTARRAAFIEGRVLRCAPLRNRRKIGGEIVESRIAEAFTELTWGKRTGYGMTEYVEKLIDGVPAGYPL
ncbi:MAG: hypothetical protein AAF384_12495 [Pseudomonadota bacterium]